MTKHNQKKKALEVVMLGLCALCSSSQQVLAADPLEGYFRTTVPASCWESSSGVCHPEQGLKIKRRDHSTYYLWLHTEGNFGHVCSFSAIARVDKYMLVSTRDKCHVVVKITGSTADVQASGETCDSFCGANVYLDVNGLKKKE